MTGMQHLKAALLKTALSSVVEYQPNNPEPPFGSRKEHLKDMATVVDNVQDEALKSRFAAKTARPGEPGYVAPTAQPIIK